MSNKTQLQTNNTNLDALISRVNAAKNIAASLPSAGGGGSSSVETVVVALDGAAPGSEENLFYYTDGSSNYKSTAFPAVGTETITVNVQKYSIVCVYGSVSDSRNGIELIGGLGTLYKTYFISDNVTLTTM